MSHPDSLEAIAAAPPALSEGVIARHVNEHYGLTGELSLLVSERDQNFRLRSNDGNSYVVKIANRAEQQRVTEFQVSALAHLESRRCPVAVPRVIRAADGSLLTQIADGPDLLNLRVVSWLAGRPLDDDVPGETLAFQLGQSLAAIDVALADFEHPGDDQSLLWDMQQAADLRQLVYHIADDSARAEVEACLDDFESQALPVFAQLRRQVIHNDLNPGNALVSDADPPEVMGVIDFGDMLRAPLIVDVAIAAAYLRRLSGDAMLPLLGFVAGFHSVVPLEEREIALLYDLVRTRLATTVTILNWRAFARSDDDAYLQKALAESTSDRFLQRVSAISRQEFSDRVSARLAG